MKSDDTLNAEKSYRVVQSDNSSDTGRNNGFQMYNSNTMCFTIEEDDCLHSKQSTPSNRHSVNRCEQTCKYIITF